MGKFLGSILTTVAGAVLTVLGNPLGPLLLAKGLSGIVGGIFSSSPKVDTASTAIKTSRPPRVSGYGISRLYGAYILYETASDGTAVDIFAVHDGEMTEVVQRYLADDRVTMSGDYVVAGEDGRYKDNKVSLYLTTGVSPGVPIAAAISKLPGIWTSSHRGDGVVLMALFCQPVKSEDFLDVYPNGVPVPSIAAKWQKCPDPYAADPADPAGWTWTENSIRQLMHYKLVREGVDYATKFAPTIAYWQAASDICDEAIALKAGGTEPRYRSAVSHKRTDQHSGVTGAILETCDGWIAPRSDGALVVYAGKFYEPTVSIGPEHIVAYEWSGVGVDDDEAVNELICSYISAEHDYNSVECDAWRDEDDIAERGEILSDNFEPQTTSFPQVRRLAKRKMARANAVYRGSTTTNIAGRIVRGERYINQRLEDAGAVFYDGPVEVTAVTRNMATGGVTFAWVSVSHNADAWNPETEEGEPAAIGDRVALEPVSTPTIDSATAEESGGGGTQIAVVIHDAPVRDDLTWYGRWKIEADTIWNEQQYSDVDAGSPVELLIGLVPAASSVDVATSYKLGDGRRSAWSVTETVET